MVALVKVQVTIHLVHEFKMQLMKLSNRQQGTGLLFGVRKWSLMTFILLIWWILLV
ncbi:hypothetical protein BB14905_06048 [Bacillus sp. B14905]|nr:hypothetical protein BB14905_06048 [Bacillus sp. B14905]